MHGESKPPPTLTVPLMMEKILVIDEGQKPHLVNLSPMVRSTITNEGIEAHLAKAWEITLWARRWTKFSSRPSCTKLKRQNFLGNSISQHSPFTMVKRILWSMWATSTKEWPSIPRTRPWCVRCSHLAWDLVRPQIIDRVLRILFEKFPCLWVESSNVSEIERPGQGCFRKNSDASKVMRKLIICAQKAMHLGIHVESIACFRFFPAIVSLSWLRSYLTNHKRMPTTNELNVKKDEWHSPDWIEIPIELEVQREDRVGRPTEKPQPQICSLLQVISRFQNKCHRKPKVGN